MRSPTLGGAAPTDALNNDTAAIEAAWDQVERLVKLDLALDIDGFLYSESSSIFFSGRAGGLINPRTKKTSMEESVLAQLDDKDDEEDDNILIVNQISKTCFIEAMFRLQFHGNAYKIKKIRKKYPLF